MKNLGRAFLLILFLALVGSFIQNSLIPFIYSIKEPYFTIPIDVFMRDGTQDNFSIRNDAYGDGVFGAKRNGGRSHKGVDLQARINSSVYASKSGFATYKYFPNGYGHLVIINHPGNTQTRYGHLYKSAISKKRWVNQGDIIGWVGKTGNANITGMASHLHFEIRVDDMPIDPVKELTRR